MDPMSDRTCIPPALRRGSIVVLSLLGLLVSASCLAPAYGASTSTSATGASSEENVLIEHSTTLSANLFCDNLYISPGATLTTNGYLIACSGSVVNHGTIAAGPAARIARGAGSAATAATTVTAGPSPNGDHLSSYGGSGGGGSSGGCSAGAATGNSTRAPGGRGTNVSTSNGVSGLTPAFPVPTVNTVRGWYVAGMQNFLEGASGETVCAGYPVGGAGSFGVFIQGKSVTVGKVIANGTEGSGTCTGSLSGSGGGGAVLIAYGSGGIVPGAVYVAGGIPTPNCGGTMYAGAGGNGSLSTLSYANSSLGAPVTGPVLLYHPFEVGRCVSLGGVAVSSSPTVAAGKVTVLWGDGAKKVGQFPLSHTYTLNGSYNLAALAAYSNGTLSAGYAKVHVPGPNTSAAPAIDLATPVIGTQSVNLSGLVSADACGPGHVRSLVISWGDNTTLSTAALPGSHHYASGGTYRICVKSKDSFGNSARACVSATIP